MIEIKQIQTGTRQLTTVDNRDLLGHKGFVEHTIEVFDASEDIDETENVDVMVFGVPFVGIVVTATLRATNPTHANSSTMTRDYNYNNTVTRDYTIKLVAKDGYDYTQFLKPDWDSEKERGITVVGLSPTMRSITQSDIYKEVMKMSIGGKEVVCVGSTENEMSEILDFTDIERRISPNCKDFSKAKSLKTGRNKADRKRNRANRWR
ncbi:hypothetical protein VPHK120G1_0031 [Vibrio phage K120 g1]